MVTRAPHHQVERLLQHLLLVMHVEGRRCLTATRAPRHVERRRCSTVTRTFRHQEERRLRPMPYVMWRGVAAPLWLVLIFMQRTDAFNSRSLSCPEEGWRSLAVTSAPVQLEAKCFSTTTSPPRGVEGRRSSTVTGAPGH